MELTGAFLERIHAVQKLNAFVSVTAELALADARRVDEARAEDRSLPLDGLPVTLKDNIDLAGSATTVGSPLFTDRIAARDAVVTARLRAAGAVVLGKTNLHELACGGTSDNATFGPVINPWSAEHIPGGSSGGAAVALAVDACIGALGTDTGSSVRLPAAFNGVVGLRPTVGAVSYRGVFPVAATFDTVGPMARSAADVRSLLDAIVGFDALDARSVDRRLDPDAEGPGVAGLRIGLPTPYFEGLDPEVEAATRAAADAFAELGAELIEVPLDTKVDAAASCGALIAIEARAVHEQDLAASPELFADDVREQFERAAGLTATDVVRLYRRVFDWKRDLRATLSQVDLLLLPTTPCGAPARGAVPANVATAAVTPFTRALSFARIPSISIPCGFAGGIPIGCQLATSWWRDRLLVRAAAAYQEITDWHRRRPSMFCSA